jgi:hypothetical protein
LRCLESRRSRGRDVERGGRSEGDGDWGGKWDAARRAHWK